MREELDDEVAGLQKMTTALPTSAAPPFSALSTCRAASHCGRMPLLRLSIDASSQCRSSLTFWIFTSGAFQALRPPASLDSDRRRDVTADYVNVSISMLPAETNRELRTELLLQEPDSATGSSPLPVLRGKESRETLTVTLESIALFLMTVSSF